MDLFQENRRAKYIWNIGIKDVMKKFRIEIKIIWLASRRRTMI